MRSLSILAFTITCVLLAQQVHADFTFGTPVNLSPPVNSAYEDATQSISADGLTLYISSTRTGGKGDWDIWVARRATRQDDWGTPQNLGAPVNTTYMDTSPCLSADGLSLLFGDGVWHLYNPRPGGFGKSDLWITTRATPDAGWGTPVNLGPIINTAAHECDPSLSADGLALFFDSDRAGGSGSVDLWMTTRESTSGPWQTPVNLGPTVNSSATEAFPWISADGLRLFFMSDRTGDYDLYVASRRTVSDAWEQAINLGRGINSSDVEACPSLSADGTTLFFMSMRSPKVGGQRDLWQVAISPSVNFDGDEKVGMEDLLLMIESWGKDDPSVDIGPMPWGDGVIDARDLEVLMSHWGEQTGLIAHWKLDEDSGITAADSAGTNTGTLVGNPTWQPAGGKIDGALQFDGDMRFVMTQFVCDPAAGPFSIFAWIKGGAPGQVILSQASGANWLLLTPEGALMTELKQAGRLGKPLISPAVLADGAWHHVGLVWDGSNRILYVDDVEVAKDTQSSLPLSLAGLNIGAGSTLSSGTFWSGLIDDVRIYNRAVTP